MTKLERLKRANRVCLHLDGKPQFRYDPCGGALELVHMSNAETGTIETVARDVVIDHGTGLLRTVGIDPWGSNQSRALALLAGWIRTGKMGMPLAWWESICGHPVLLGDGKMFEAVQREIFEVKP